MQARLSELAELVGGHLVGPDLTIGGATIVRDAAEGEITFIDSAENLPLLEQTAASAAVVPRGLRGDPLSVIEVDEVQPAFARIHQHFKPPREARRIGISPAAIISPKAQLADDVDVRPGAIIDDDVVIGAGSTVHAGVRIMAGCQIGQQVTLFPNVVLYEDTIIHDLVIVHAGAVIGAYGFGYRLVDGHFELGAQFGNVVLESHVEIGAGSTIDRGSYGSTRIGEGTKLDDQVMIGHNCRIGRHNLLCSQVGIAGSSSSGDYVMMGGQVGVRDHVHIGDRVHLGAQAGVNKDVPPGERYFGCPATPVREFVQSAGAGKKIVELRRRLKQLEKMVKGIKQQVGAYGREAA